MSPVKESREGRGMGPVEPHNGLGIHLGAPTPIDRGDHRAALDASEPGGSRLLSQAAAPRQPRYGWRDVAESERPDGTLQIESRS